MIGETPPQDESSISKEIERKFLIEDSDLKAMLQHGFDPTEYPHKRIEQGYLVSNDECAVRVRRKGDRFYLTYKSAPTEHIAERTELEVGITQEQFEALWPATVGRRIQKIRYEIPVGDGVHTIELDVFEGDNAGHVLAEVEFASRSDADAFQPPAWFGIDVTADKEYGNASIAEHGFPGPHL